MSNESEPDKKLRIRPRGMDEKDKDPEASGNSAEAETSGSKKLKWDNRLRQSGAKFPAKMVSKPLKPAGSLRGEKELTLPSGEGEPEPDKSPAPEAGPGGTDTASQPKAIRPEERESSFLPRPEPGKEGDVEVTKPTRNDLLPIIRRPAFKRVRLVYAVAAGLVAVVAFSILFWNLGVGAGIQSSLDEETKERASVSKEFLADIDLALAELRAGDADKAAKKLQELEGAKADVASLTYLLAMAAVQNGDIPLAEAKTAESIAKHERISDSLALQAVLETQKGADGSIKKFGDPRMRSELLLRQAILADAANPFPMVELATLLRYQKRTDEALALLRGARSRLNPVDSHSVVDVTIKLAMLQETPDANLPQIADPGKDLISSFSAAYIAMRKGDFDQAADIVKIARKMAPEDLFYYLINDPAIRRYASEPKLREFFQ